MARAASSYIETNGATRTRKADSLTWPLTARPQALTIYLRFIETGNLQAQQFANLIRIGSGPRVTLEVITSTGYGIAHSNTSNTAVSVSSQLTAAPTPGQLVELCGQLYADGSVQAHQSINGGTVTSATKSGTAYLAAAWGNNVVTVGDMVNFKHVQIPLRDILIVRGVHSLQAMRIKAGLTP